MNLPERRALVAFGVRFMVLFVASLMPIPWLPDAYATAIGRATNAVLSVTDAGSLFAVRFVPPPHIDREGSWKAIVRVDNRRTAKTMMFRLDARSFSYRPMATFVALAAASSFASFFRGTRRRVVLWVGGLLSMFLITTCFSALPLLSQFAVAGVFGDFPGLLVRTVYQATATPVMVYAIPLIVWWLWMHATPVTRISQGASRSLV
jgi:hypothetical protein